MSNAIELCGMDLSVHMIENEVDADVLVRYTTYGIEVLAPDNSTYLRIENISTDCAFVENFIAICKDHRLPGIHIRDVLKDYAT